MKRFFTLALRWFCLGVFLAALFYAGIEAIQRTPWYRQHLVKRLHTGDRQEQLRAATALAQMKCQKELLSVLQSDVSSAREFGRRALEHIWFTSAGNDAYQRLQRAHEAMEKKEFQRALAVLDGMIDRYPKYAEGWNRRAAVYWELGNYEKSLADAERALALNPYHYGAMQGIGICYLQLGEVGEACRYLRAALKILPHDIATRESLQKCEDLLRVYPPPGKKFKTHDVI